MNTSLSVGIWRAFHSTRVWCAVCLIVAALMAWQSRYSMNPDGISYLDMASETARHGPSNLVNGWWSPLYPALLSLAIWLFRPSPEQEFPLVHALNWVVFAVVTLCFLFLLRSRRDVGHSSSTLGIAEPRFGVPLAFAIFLSCTTQLVPASLVGPDLCVCGCVFLIAGVCMRLASADSDWRGYAALGFVLGIGYYAKTAMFPIGLLLLAILCIWPLARPARRVRNLGTAAVVFLITCAPLIVLISQREGHASFGEAGRLNYAWFVNGMEPMWQGWTDGGSGYGTPQHPPRVLLDHPRVLEFASPLPGTYPLWFDPSYWYAGATARFDFGQQVRTLLGNLRQSKPLILMLCASVALGIVLARRPMGVLQAESSVCLMLWAVAACLLYAMVLVQSRYIAGFVGVFWLTASSLAAVRRKTWVQGVLLLLVGVYLAVAAARGPRNDVSIVAAADSRVVADRLRLLGVRPGDRLAVVGDGFYAFYARMVGARIVAEIPDVDGFWRLDCTQAEVLRQRLRTVGVRVLVAADRPASSACAAWHSAPGSNYKGFSMLSLEVPSLLEAKNSRDGLSSVSLDER